MEYTFREKIKQLEENELTTDKIGDIALEEIYPIACNIFEMLEEDEKIFGNGHVMSQKFALLAKLIIMKRSLLGDVDKKKFDEYKKEMLGFLNWIW